MRSDPSLSSASMSVSLLPTRVTCLLLHESRLDIEEWASRGQLSRLSQPQRRSFGGRTGQNHALCPIAHFMAVVMPITCYAHHILL